MPKMQDEGGRISAQDSGRFGKTTPVPGENYFRATFDDIESTINRIGPEIHPLSKKAKDVGSAVVLVALFQALMVWGIVVWPIVSAWT